MQQGPSLELSRSSSTQPRQPAQPAQPAQPQPPAALPSTAAGSGTCAATRLQQTHLRRKKHTAPQTRTTQQQHHASGTTPRILRSTSAGSAPRATQLLLASCRKVKQQHTRSSRALPVNKSVGLGRLQRATSSRQQLNSCGPRGFLQANDLRRCKRAQIFACKRGATVSA
jgi:hypothetical protein